MDVVNVNTQHVTLSDTEDEGESLHCDSEVSEDEEPTLSDMDFVDDSDVAGQPLSDDDYVPSSSEEDEGSSDEESEEGDSVARPVW